MEKLRPTCLKDLRSFLGAVNQFNKFISDLASICFPFRTILKKAAPWIWTKCHEKAFTKIHQEVKKVAEVTHFKRNKPLRIICDANNQGLGAVLQQCEEYKWKPISYASRFLSELESKYSINELELLAVVWSVEHFKNYVYGVAFGIIPDHKALQTVLESNKGNKTFSSRLTRWVDRLLPFDFAIVHTPGWTLGMADYLSRHESDYEESEAKAEEFFNDWFTVNVVKEISPKFKRLADTQEPIKLQENTEVKHKRKSEVLTDQKRMQTITASMQSATSSEHMPMAEQKTLANSKVSQVYVRANVENDRLIQKVINRVQNRNAATRK